MIAHIWFLRERERILRIIRDAWTFSIFLREHILQSGIGDPLNLIRNNSASFKEFPNGIKVNYI